MAITQYQTKKGLKFRAEHYINAIRTASKAGFNSQEEAQAWLNQQDKMLKQILQATSTGFLGIANAYLDDMQTRRQHNTWQYKRAALRRFMHFMGADFALEGLTPQQIDAFFFARRDSSGPKAANRDLVELKAVMNWAIRKNLYQSNPFRPIEPFAEEAFQRRIPTLQEIESARAQGTQDQQDFIDILRFTGARLSEVCALRWEDVDLSQRTITLWTRKRQGGNNEPRVLGIPDTLVSVLAARAEKKSSPWLFVGRNGLVFTKNSVRLWLPDLCAKAGIKPPFTAHGIRHYVATCLKESQQATPFQIQNFLGHKNITTTEKYLHELYVDRNAANILEQTTTHKNEEQQATLKYKT